jgi:L-asparaginase
LVVLNDLIHAAQLVRKANTILSSAFESSAGELGWLAEGRPTFLLNPRAHSRVSPDDIGPAVDVALVSVSLGDDGRLLTTLADHGYAGAVVEALGGGHVPPEVASAIESVAATIPVVLAARPREGSVLRNTYSFEGSERDLLAKGVIPAGWLDGPKARVLLTLMLRTGASRSRIEEAFLEFS